MKKKDMVVISIFILAFILFSGCTQKIQGDALSRLDYSNREFGFGLNPPINWTLNTSESYGNYVIFNCPQNITYIPTSMSINASRVNSSDNLDLFFTSYIQENQINGKLSNYTLISRTERTLSNFIAYENIYTYTTNDKNIIKVKNLLINPKEDTIICFQYITPIQTYHTFEYTFEFIFESLTFI